VTYTEADVVAVVAALLLDLVLLRTRLLTTRLFWVSYAIVLFFQLIVNGLLTGLQIVTYDPAQILGPRVAFAPVEDIAFGFAMVTATLSVWVWVGRLASGRRRAEPRRHDATR